MTKNRRERLFGDERPVVRELDLEKDMAILWAAYKTKSFDMPEFLTQEEFYLIAKEYILSFTKGWLIEDRNAKFKSGYGAVGIVLANYDGWTLKPTYDIFSWATTRNKLRTIVQFLVMQRYSKDTGIVIIEALPKDKKILNRVERYGVLTYSSTIPKGSVRGDINIYYTHGRK